jgi:hypothetical protein
MCSKPAELPFPDHFACFRLSARGLESGFTKGLTGLCVPGPSFGRAWIPARPGSGEPFSFADLHRD